MERIIFLKRWVPVVPSSIMITMIILTCSWLTVDQSTVQQRIHQIRVHSIETTGTALLQMLRTNHIWTRLMVTITVLLLRITTMTMTYISPAWDLTTFIKGDGTFTDITELSGIGSTLWSSSATFFDYDLDSYLDLYVVNYVHYRLDQTYQPCIEFGYQDYCNLRYYEGAPDQLYRNNGDGTFTDVTKSAGIN